jgi:hypothetical protein
VKLASGAHSTTGERAAYVAVPAVSPATPELGAAIDHRSTLFFFLWNFQALNCQRQARIVLVRRYSGDHPYHYGSYVAVARRKKFFSAKVDR